VNSSATTIAIPLENGLRCLGSGNWVEDLVPECLWTSLIRWRGHLAVRSSASSGTDPWGEDLRTLVVTRVVDLSGRPTLQDLGWTQTEALEIRMRLKSFEEDWEFPGMQAYDEL